MAIKAPAKLKSNRKLARHDGWQNIVTNLGIDGKDQRLNAAYRKRRKLINEIEIEDMYQEDPIFARIVDAIPEHATRRWIKIEGSLSGEKVDDSFGRSVLDALSALDAQSQCYELMRLDRLMGGAVMILGVDDNQDPAKPLNMKQIRSVKHLNVLSRFEIFPQGRDNNPMSPNYRQPEYYTFSGVAIGANTNIQRIHYSRVIRLTGIQTTLRSYNMREGWGLPVIERVYDTVRQFGTIYDYTESLFKDLIQGVMTIPGLDDMIASDSGNQLLIKRMQLINLAASAFNMVLLNDNEKYERRVTSFGGIAEVMIRMMDKLCAVAEMPLSILFGQAPTGLSTDDKGGRTTFYDMIANHQRRLLRNPLARIIACVLAAKDGPTKGVMPAKWSFDFLPLTEPTEQETAATELVRVTADEKLIQNAVITPEEARTRLAADPRNPYLLDIDAEVVPTKEELGSLTTPTISRDPFEETPTHDSVDRSGKPNRNRKSSKPRR